MAKDLTTLHQKVDQLSAQMEILTEIAEVENRRRQEFEELKDDLIPIGNQLVQLTINELAEIGTDFELEDLLFLLKRVLRNTQLILAMMDRLEALMGVADEVELLGKQVFSTIVEALDKLERDGFFTQATEILQTLTKRETMEDLNQALQAFYVDPEETPKTPSPFRLLRELNQPETRRGIGRLLQILKTLGGAAQLN
ncbi:MAG: DUF1641 domain-containing protein [Anaerolineales bacterium]